jgi:ligand-binding sensor domain-containing protein
MDTGIAVYDGSDWRYYTTANSELPSDTVYQIAIDDDGTKWIATDEGLAAFNENGLLSTDAHSKTMDDIILFPNPANDFITLKMPDGLQNSTVNIFDIQGKKIKTYSINNNRERLDVSAFPSGIYLVKIQSDENYTVKRIVKQ